MEDTLKLGRMAIPNMSTMTQLKFLILMPFQMIMMGTWVFLFPFLINTARNNLRLSVIASSSLK